MRGTYNEIVSLLNSKGERLGMSASSIGYSSKNDPGSSVPGYATRGVRETINIPNSYMKKAGVSNAREFLSWLKSQ